MSIPAEKAAWAIIESGEFELGWADKAVLLKIAFWANKEWECWHGTAAIAQAVNGAVSTASDSLQKLHRYGLLKKRPRQQKKGRGRATNVIVFDPAADSGSLHLNLDDQIRVEAAADSDSDPQQIRDRSLGTNKALERDLKGNLKEGAFVEVVGPRDARKKLPTIDGLLVTEDELEVAAAALATFNERNGSKLHLLGRAGRSTESMTRIICRLRETPDLTAEDLVGIVNRNFDNPWWKGGASVGVIFGPKTWERAMANKGVRENRSGRRTRLDIDRPISKKEIEEEPW